MKVHTTMLTLFSVGDCGLPIRWICDFKVRGMHLKLVPEDSVFELRQPAAYSDLFFFFFLPADFFGFRFAGALAFPLTL